MDIIDLGLQFRSEQLAVENTPRTLYVHHSGGIRTVIEYHEQHLGQGWAGFGYNFAVDLEGLKYKGRDPQYIPAGIAGFNKDSLHIVAIGNFENMVMPEIQKKSIQELVALCKEKWPTITTVKGHCEVMATDCPGKNYPLSDIKAAFTTCISPTYIPKPTPAPINNKVFKLQHILNEMGITDKNNNKLVEDGWIGELTLSALRKSLIKRGANNKLVGWIQEILKVSIDNIYGNIPYHETYDAICSFQRAYALLVDGIVGINTWTELVK